MRSRQLVILIFVFLSGVAQAQDRYIVVGAGLAKENAGNGSSDCLETMTPETTERLSAKAKPIADQDALNNCQKIGGTSVVRADDYKLGKRCEFFGTVYTVSVSANYQCMREGLPPGNFQERVMGACHDAIRSEDLILSVQTLTKALEQRAAAQCPGKSPVVSAYNIETGSQHCAGFGVQVFAQGNVAAECASN